MTKAEVIQSFDPNGVGLRNGHFIGLPFTEATAELILLSIPWDVTVSYRAGTSTGPTNILQASVQLDLFDPDVEDAWKLGIYFQPPAADIAARNDALRPVAEQYIEFLENGGDPAQSLFFQRVREEIDHACAELKERVRSTALQLLQSGKLLGLVGGDHSTPLGFLEALAETYPSFGVLHLDAHMDLREAYEGFRYSHASIFFNALQLESITQLTQVGIRDFCAEELEQAKSQGSRVAVFLTRTCKNTSSSAKLGTNNAWTSSLPYPKRSISALT